MGILDILDEQQLSVATAPNGVIKVVAGAGTGKTTALMGRVTYLIANGVNPRNIQVVTFTKKASGEFKHRLEKEIGAEAAAEVRVSTFHSYCARFLRQHYQLAGMSSPNFMLADDGDVEALMLRATIDSAVAEPYEPPVRDESVSNDEYKKFEKSARREYDRLLKDIASEAKETIARWKESGLTVEMLNDPTRAARSQVVEMNARIYLSYQDALERRNMMDFADLILKTVDIFSKYPDLREREAEKNSHLLVDEFQDCNLTQAQLVQFLSSVHENLMVVGDPDQSIYAFRAACPAIMNDMRGPGVTEVTLVNNRRSVQPILDAANLIVDYAAGRQEPKVLNSALDCADENPIRVSQFADDFKEAMDAAIEIKKLIDSGTPPNEIAILLRMTRMSLPFEEQLIRKRIPYRIWKGTSLLEKPELRDMLAYLKLAANPTLDTAFERICNRPVRGLGDVAMTHINGIAAQSGGTFADACAVLSTLSGGGVRLRQDAKVGAQTLSVLLNDITDFARNNMNPSAILEYVLRETGYRDWVTAQNGEDAYKCMAHIDLLLDIASDFDNVYDFLNEIHLMTDADARNTRDEVVQIMTIHASKGLEFDVVFLPGLEDGTLPHKSAKEDDQYEGSLTDPWIGPNLGGTNEERCLAHVAFTRARKKLNVSYATKRGFGSNGPLEPSQFLREADLLGIALKPTMSGGYKPKRSPQPQSRHFGQSFGGRPMFGPKP